MSHARVNPPSSLTAIMSSKLEKQQYLPLATEAEHQAHHRSSSDKQPKKCCSKGLRVVAAFLLFLGITSLAMGGAFKDFKLCSGIQQHLHEFAGVVSSTKEETCPQVDVLQPVKYGEVWKEVSKEIGKGDAFRHQVVDWLSGSVQVQYVFLLRSFCGLGSGF